MPSPSTHEYDPSDREDAPFLSSSSDNGPATAEPKHRHVLSSDAPDTKLRFRLMLTLFAMILAIETGFAMSNGPMTRIYESIACREYFAQHDPSQIPASGQVAEELCKVNEIQAEVAIVKGYMEFFDGLLSAVLAVPYGLLADRYGRKPTICLGIPGFAINAVILVSVMWFSDIFPLRAVWFSCVGWVFGGGPVVAFAIIWTMMADVTEESQRASIFFQFGVVGMGAEFLSSAVSSLLMSLDPWIPMLSGLGIICIGIILALTLPETMHAVPSKPKPSPEASSSSPVELAHLSSNDPSRKSSWTWDQEPLYHDDSSSSNNVDEAKIPSSVRTTSNKNPHSLLSILYTRYHSTISPYTFLLRNRQLLLLLSAFLVYRLSRGSSWFLVQYISTRFSWPLARANLLLSFKPALTVPLFLFVLPAISKRLLRSMSPPEKDLRLARTSIVCLTLGTLGIGLSPSVATLVPSLLLQTAGSGFLFLTRSLVTVLVRREETARLYTVIEVLQSLGNVLASLAITNVFKVGLELGGAWVGLAWIMTSSMFCMVGIAVWVFRLPGKVGEDTDMAEVD